MQLALRIAILLPAISWCFPSPAVAEAKENSGCVVTIVQKVVNDLEAQTIQTKTIREAIDLYVENNPDLKELGFGDMLKWFDANDKLGHVIWRIHLEDWLHQLKMQDTASIQKLRESWLEMTPQQKANAAISLKQVIDRSDLTKVFDIPANWTNDFRRLENLDLNQSQAQEFNKRWKLLSDQERELFVFATISDELPDILLFLLPKGTRERIMAGERPDAAPVMVKVSTGRMSSKKVAINNNTYRAFRRQPSDAVNAWINRSRKYINDRSEFTFDEILYYVSQIKGDTDTWRETYHAFRSMSEEQAKTVANFAHQDNDKIGRIGSNTNNILKMVDKLDVAPNEEQLRFLKKEISNSREQWELLYRLKERFPDHIW